LKLLLPIILLFTFSAFADENSKVVEIQVIDYKVFERGMTFRINDGSKVKVGDKIIIEYKGEKYLAHIGEINGAAIWAKVTKNFGAFDHIPKNKNYKLKDIGVDLGPKMTAAIYGLGLGRVHIKEEMDEVSLGFMIIDGLAIYGFVASLLVECEPSGCRGSLNKVRNYSLGILTLSHVVQYIDVLYLLKTKRKAEEKSDSELLDMKVEIMPSGGAVARLGYSF